MTVHTFWPAASKSRPAARHGAAALGHTPPPALPLNDAATKAPAPEPIPAAAHPDYPLIVKTLRRIAAAHGRGGRNTFYLSPVKTEGVPYLEVYWEEDKSILTLYLRQPDGLDTMLVPEMDWLYYKYRLDLTDPAAPAGLRDGVSARVAERAETKLINCLAGQKLIIH